MGAEVWLVLLAPLLAAGLVLVLIPLAYRVGVVDSPGGRKTHKHATPLVGGGAIALAFVAIIALTGHIPGHSYSLLAAIAVAVVIGLMDDAHEVSHRAKFVAQIMAALLIVSGAGIRVTYLGDLFGIGEIVLGKWDVLVTVLAIVGLMNAVNLIDGLDGLAGSVIVPPLLLFAGMAIDQGNYDVAFELLVLIGAVVGFLFFNLRTPWRKRALVFMGDTGSLLLGLMLVWYAIVLAGTPEGMIRPIVAVWILAVPLLDMGSVMVLRILQRKSPFHADRQHMHHVLLDAGCSVTQAVFIMTMCSLACGFMALLAQAFNLPEPVLFVLFLVFWVVYLMILSNPKICLGWLGRLLQPQQRSDE